LASTLPIHLVAPIHSSCAWQYTRSQILLCQIIFKLVIPAGKRVSSAMDGKPKSIHGAWIPAQICLQQIYINPQGVRQDSLV